MEVVASVSAAVPVAMLLADRVIKYLNDKGNSGAEENVQQLRRWLSSFQAFIKEKEKQEKSYVSKDLVGKIVGLTADIEDALDDFIFDCIHTSAFRQSLQHLAHALKDPRPVRRLSSCKQKIENIILGDKLIDRLSRESGGLELRDARSEQFLEEGEIVGFTTRRKELRSQLVNEDSKRTTILVVGPGGSGKTFLVKKVYLDEEVQRHFPCRAWIQLSRCYSDPQKLLTEVLNQFDPTRDVGQIVDGAGIISIAQKVLNRQRYLIVLDNVWSRQDYTLIVNSLPNQDTGHGSRIIITSRNSDVADQPVHIHKLDGLILEEAKELFFRRAFPDRQDSSSGSSFPEDMREVSEKILNKCNCLPLAIAVVGSLLSKEDGSQFFWEKFYGRLASEIESDPKLHIISSILQPSFVDLPDNLKSCFLYFSIFPEGQSISRGRLIRSWLAEGFVEGKRGKTPEEVAETYLNELISRSLVRASAREIDGRVRTCQVLRFYHDFIVPLSGDGNFVTVVDQKSKPTLPDEKVRRLSFHESFPAKLSQISDLKHVRTLFVFGKMDESWKDMISFRSKVKGKMKGANSQDLKNVFNKFKLLKVLDLEKVDLQNLPKDIGSFVLLKNLNLRHTNIETVPDTIEKLYLLETLDLKYTLVKELPKWIHKLQKLRHLLVSDISLGEAQGAKVSSGIGSLSSLQKVSLIVVDNLDVIKELGSSVELRQLGLAYHQNNFGRALCETIQKLQNLSKFDVRAITGEFLELDHMQRPPQSIQRLHLKGRLPTLPSWFSLLSNLVKVVLKCSRLNDDQNPLEIVESLSNLMELEMVDYYTGKKLVFKARTFKNLRKLHVEKFDELTEVVVEDLTLAMLQNLTICKCKKLKPLTTRYHLGKLEELVVYEMSDAFISDIQRRIMEVELVHHIQKCDEPSSSSTSNRGIRGRIRSYRHFS